MADRYAQCLADPHSVVQEACMAATTSLKEDSDYVDLLVIRAQAGDALAFNFLVEKYRGQVVRSVSRFTCGSLDCEDIAQETFIRAYRGLRTFRRDSTFSTWIYRIAINVAKSAYISYKKEWALRSETVRENADFPEQNHGSVKEEWTDSCDMENPELILISKQTVQRINSALDGMPAKFRTALILREMDKMSYQEAAKVMACPVGTVRSRVFRAREILLMAPEQNGLRRRSRHY